MTHIRKTKHTGKTLFAMSLLGLSLSAALASQAQDTPAPTRITTTQPAGLVGQPIQLTARLIAGTAHVSGEMLMFYIVDADGNGQTLSAVTGGNGLACVQYTPTAPGLAYFNPVFAGDNEYAKSVGGGVMIVK